ncbi:BatA domain-containing protein [Aureisphaera galaxeae]|uniref:BatA domain-containing protein n=1 Tax=Aureisphaera galaxeae TaxID=1538023 RepID=UPI0023501D52|nr:BatA domain-containing protein [Aureisphaera galaxeae]MDC8003974.1 BatA domain-containing protein [Aureisphaera galaxeae]
MQFKHPELLYALLLLLIPILIHLFQLRRFQKVEFTNVAFLKKVTLQTRKSSRLKKWLTLLMRLLALACIILAFAQPFSASKTALNTEKETVLYLDNSFSMQAKGPNGPLLARAKQQLFELLNGNDKLSWFTNDDTQRNVSQNDLKGEILSIQPSHAQLNLDEVLLKGNQLFTDNPASEKRLILITDLQNTLSFPEVKEGITTDVVTLSPVTTNNVSIDTAYISGASGNSLQLEVRVSAEGEVPPSIPISLLSKGSLIAKTAVDFSNSRVNTVSFTLENVEGLQGELRITDADLPYDNSLYFSVNTPKSIKVLSINQADPNFLQRLFDQAGYEYLQQSHDAVNYNDIPAQDFIVLNELETIPVSLINSLKAFSDGGGSLLVIPSSNSDLSAYNTLLNALGIGSFSSEVNSEKNISKINFSHPLYASVFEKQVTNFQFPKVNSYLEVSTNATPLLRFDDNKPFLLQQAKSYVGTAAFSSENSNFKSSPLIVPTLINMAQQSLPLPELYYEIGRQNTYAIPISLTQDEIISLKDSISSFIPLQQTKANSVEITTTDDPGVSGNYTAENGETFLEYVAYNYPRGESQLQYGDVEDWEGVTVHSSVAQLFDTIASDNKINSFWKWFVIFALVFLLGEMLILKFMKN